LKGEQHAHHRAARQGKYQETTLRAIHHPDANRAAEGEARHCEEPATKLQSNFALERRSNP
jgi:hypothetical protein